MASQGSFAERHWRESGATQRVPIFEVVDSAADVGESIVEMLHFRKCNAFGKHNGQWVQDDTIHCILQQIQELEDAKLCLFRPFQTLTCESRYSRPATKASAAVIDPKKDIVIIVNDADNAHFFTILLETFSRQKSIHVFDSLVNRKDEDIKRLLASIFLPSMYADYNFHNYAHHNVMKNVLQSGASCGPWSLWIGVAFVFDINNCRRRRSDKHGRMRVASLKMTNADVVGCWKHLTF